MNVSKRNYALIAGAAIILLLILVAFVFPRVMTSNANASALETQAVRRGTLIATVSATGAISPVREAQMAFSATGPLTKLNVQQGDQVQAGQLLAALDTRELELQVTQAEANLAAAQAKLDQLKNPQTSDVAAAQANLTSAEAALSQLKNPNPNDVAAAKADVDKAQAAVARAQSEYDRIGGASNPMIGMTPQSLALQQATQDYQKALALFNSKFNPTDAQLKQAQANIDQARSQLAHLTTPNPNDLKVAQANVDQASAGRDLAKAHLDDVIIRAPFDGVVSHVDLDVGSFVTAGKPWLAVADISQLRVKLNIDETDIAKIKNGQEVTLNLDAYPDVDVPAKVIDVASVATTVQGVVNYVVTVALNATNVPVKIGMTADANIVVEKKDNVLLVPNSAVRAENNKRFVMIQSRPGQTQEVEVKLGMANDQETEVLSGLSEGQQVVTSPTIQNPISNGGFGSPKR